MLRYRTLLVRQMVQLKTRLASLLMETGVSYDRQQLHRLGFVSELLANEDAIKSIRPLLRVSQDSILRLRHIESALIRPLERDPLLAERVRRLQTVPCVGRITALTWALEMGDISRFRSIRQAITRPEGCFFLDSGLTWMIGRQSFVINWTIVPVHKILENVVDAFSSEFLVQHRGQISKCCLRSWLVSHQLANCGDIILSKHHCAVG